MIYILLALLLAFTPVLITLLVKPNVNLRVILLAAFIMGTVSLIGFPNQLYKLLLEINVIILFTSTILLCNKNKTSYHTPGIVFFLIYSVLVVLSTLINDSSGVSMKSWTQRV